MYRIILVFALLFQDVFSKNCDVPLQHYEELGCKPVYKQPKDDCPSHYVCDDFSARSLDKCYYKGRQYLPGERVDSSLTSKNCIAACFCSDSATPSKFVCAHIDCPEFFGNPLEPGCYRKRDHENCCSIGTQCPPFDKVAKCVVGGETFLEGQSFSNPEQPCSSCICQSGFSGKFTEPFCKPVTCGIELKHAQNFRDKCAAIYYGRRGCCPIQWQCPQDGDRIVPADTPTKGEKCVFGAKTMNIGDKLLLKKYSPHSPDVDCECIVPPMVTCIQKPSAR